MKKNLLLLILLLGFFSLALAQNRTIKGKVTDAKDGSPLPGVTVIVKGAAGGTQTDLNGAYTLTVAASAKTLVFRYIGFKEADLPITGATLDVQLEADPK